MEIRKRKPIGKKNIKYIEELYAEYSKRLFFIARKYVENEDFAEDVVQSAFAKVLTYPDGILKVPRDEVFYFLSTVLKHEAYDIIQEEKDNEHESLVYDDGTEGDFIEDPRDNYLQMIDLDSLKYNLSRMKRRHRDTLLFRYVYGLKCKEIADIFKISERTVKIRCSEARVQLKKMMEEDELEREIRKRLAIKLC